MTHVYVVGPTPPHKGGIAHFNARLIQELETRVRVTAVGLREHPRWFRKDWTDPSQWNGLQPDALPLLGGASPRSWLELARRLRLERPDKLLLHWVHPAATPMYWTLMRLAHRVPGLSVELIVHNLVPHEHRRLGAWISRYVFRQATRLIVHGQGDAKRLDPLRAGQSIVTAFHPVYDIFGGPDLAAADALKRRLGLYGPVLLFFGFIRPYKGLDVLLKAMPGVLGRFPNASLVVAGQPLWGSEKSIRPLVRDLGIADAVRLEERYIHNEEVAGYFTAADLVVFPYLHASHSGSLQVAYAFDRPVVATRVGGLSEAVEDGVSGRLATPGSPESLAQAIERALSEPIPAQSVRDFRQRFGWDRYVDLLLQ